MPVLYRSLATRWTLAATGLLAGLALVFGTAETWRSTPSLHWLQWQAHVPLRVVGVLFLVYAVGLLLDRTRPKAYALGTALCALFAISIAVASHLTTSQPKNAAVLALMIDAAVFHAFSIRTSMVQAGEP